MFFCFKIFIKKLSLYIKYCVFLNGKSKSCFFKSLFVFKSLFFGKVYFFSKFFFSRSNSDPVDIGVPPGKGNGAAGLSPWLFAHLDRNWVRKETTKDLKKLKTPTKRKSEIDLKSKNKNLKKFRMRSALDLIKTPKMDSD